MNLFIYKLLYVGIEAEYIEDAVEISTNLLRAHIEDCFIVKNCFWVLGNLSFNKGMFEQLINY